MKTIYLRIEKYAPPGNGLGFYQDKAVFVPQTSVGDEVLVSVEKEKKRYIIGNLLEVEKPGPGRRQVPCPHYAECGGCDLLHIPYKEQLALKKEMLVEVLNSAGIEAYPEMVAAPEEFSYRHRALFRYDQKSGRLGFLRRRSHQVAAVPGCLMLAPPLVQLLEYFAKFPQRLGKTTSFYGLASSAGSFAAASLVAGGRKFKAFSGIPEKVIENYGFGDLELAASGFAQANPAIIRLLILDLLEKCNKAGDMAELYGGSGTFSLALATIVSNLTVYESDPAAAARGGRNTARNGFKNVRFISGRVEKKSLPTVLDTLVVDPPRSGLNPVVIEKIGRSSAAKIIYISCNPATLARDLARLAKLDNDLTIESITGYDMYAGTTHLEVMAVLKR